MPEKKFVLCVDGVYVKNGKIFLLKRDVEPFRGCWHVVGGHVEEDECVRDALKREFKEETGLDAEIGEIIDGRVEKTSDRIKIIVVLRVTSGKGEIKLNSENREFGWFKETPSNSVCNYSKYLR